jgi:hypothetical protein
MRNGELYERLLGLSELASAVRHGALKAVGRGRAAAGAAGHTRLRDAA